MTRSRGRTLAALPLLVTVGFIAFGCRALEDIPDGVCGNAVLDHGEDCERFVPNNDPRLHCGGPETAEACRFTCDRARPNEAACPEGYGCGVGGICRTPSGSFEEFVQYPSPATSVVAGDFDGDGRSEVIATTPRRAVEVLGVGSSDMTLRARVVAGRGVNQMPVVPVRESGAVALGVTRTGGIVSVFKATEGPALQPEFYSAFHLADTLAFRLGTAEVLPGTSDDGPAGGMRDSGLEPIVVVADAKEGVRLSFVDGVLGRRAIERLSKPATDLAGVRLVAGRFDESLPCDAVPLPFRRSTSLDLAQLCRRTAGTIFANDFDLPEHVPPRKIALEAGYVVGEGGVHAVDVDGDKHVDLVIDAALEASGERATLVAFGLGDGRFHGSPFMTLPISPDGKAARAEALDDCAPNAFPLAMGRLTNDDLVDCVMPRAVRYRVLGAPTRTLLIDGPSPLNEAVIADVNANGLDDVVGLTVASVDVISSTGAYGHRFSQPATNPGYVSVGDLDGDLVADIAYRDAPDGKETVTLLYGSPFGWPSYPIALGVTSDVRQIVIGAVSNVLGGNDEVTDLGVVSEQGQSFSVAMIRGNTARQLEAPFALGEQSGTGLDRNLAEAIVSGRFLPNTAGGADAMAVVATKMGKEGDRRRLWLVPPEASRLFDPEKATATRDDLDPSYDYELARGAAADLDGDGVDELVLIAPPKSEGARGRVMVARHDAGALVLSSSFEVGLRGAAAPEWQVVAADLDGVPGAEVAVRVDDGAASKVFVFFAEGAGLAPTASEVVLPPDLTPSSIGAIAMATTRGRSLLVGTTAGMKTPGTVRQVVLRGRTPELAPTPVLKDLKTPRGLAARDIDGDGVEDLIVADAAYVTVHYGKPVNR